jgi:aryl-alcohol dehydrogenase-like predicted oxidoreductase
MLEPRKLGARGPEVSAVGLGCMAMSGVYGTTDRDESIATIHSALDAGITLLDTGDFYGMGHNELLIADALRERNRDDVLISAGLATTLARPRSRPRWRTRCSACVPTTSTSTDRPAWMRTCRSKRRWARSRKWCKRVMSAT